MENTMFDRWTRDFSRSRRQAVRLLAGGALGAATAALGWSDASAACKRHGQKCKKHSDCCANAKCTGKNKKCRCPGGTAGCLTTCCAPGQVCQQGANSLICANGPLQPGATCSPAKPLACASGTCACISNDDLGSVCTCRQVACLGLGSPCTKTSECCVGGCDGFSETCEIID